MNWMIYGANGYTGKLVVERALVAGHKPILAGRSAEAVLAMGRKYDLPARVFSLDNPSEAAKNLNDVDVVLHCAGPFSRTAWPMLEACIESKTNYLDITGEISVFETLQQKSELIAKAGICAISGVGFDVVPTDCLAVMLKNELPDAKTLRLGIKGIGQSLSGGTAKTMLEGVGKGGCIRKDGKLLPVPAAHQVRMITFNGKSNQAVSMPWGDVATAFYSTGIPNIEVYFAATKSGIKMMRLAWNLRSIISSPLVQAALKQLIGMQVSGPSDQERAESKITIWGEVESAAGKKVAMLMQCPNGYTTTVDSSLAIVEKILNGECEKKGALTPAQAFGAELALSLPGITVQKI
jgi:short subunit dehydrogenase-like uncharacterized protein